MGKVNVLVVRPYHLSVPPQDGGQLRTFHLLRHLPDRFRSQVVAFAARRETSALAAHLVQRTIPKTRFGFLLEGWISALNGGRDCSFVAAAILGNLQPAWRRTLRELAATADILVAEFPYLCGTLPRRRWNQRLVYHAHNVEANLQQAMLPTTLVGRLTQRYVRHLEQRACVSADLVVACTREDGAALCRRYGIAAGKVCILPNGVPSGEIRPPLPQEKIALARQYQLSGRNVVVFLGTRHFPNLEAVNFIVEELAPALPDCTFLVAGGVTAQFLESRGLAGRAASFPPARVLRRPYAASGGGWYEVERWPTVQPVRWTGRQFSLCCHRAGVTGVAFTAYCPRPMAGVVSVNGRPVGEFTACKRWQQFAFHFGATAEPRVTVTVAHAWKVWGDLRPLGIAVASARFCTGASEVPVDLERLAGLGFYLRDNVILVERFAAEEKLNFLQLADVAINPMFHGSGSNLKMFEYLAAGLPVIATPVGARGIAGNPGQHFLVVQPAEFPAAIRRLFADDALQTTLQQHGRQLVVEEYDWRKISQALAERLEHLLAR